MSARFVRRPFFVMVAVLLVALPAAAQEGEIYYPTTEWRTSTPEEQGIDSARLLAALDYIEEQDIPVDSITVIRHGYVVLDAYYHPYTADMQHHLWAATEGFIATLVGIAVDQGLIAGLDQPLLALFPELTIANRTDFKESLTIRDLLTNRSGITCGPNAALMEAYLAAPDSLGYLLDLPIVSQTREFSYCWFNSDILSGAVEAAAGMPLLAFAEQYLFGPLGITDYRWQTLPDGLPFGELGLHLTPHDLARLGYLYLHGGRWAREQVVSSAWVDTVTCADPAVCPFYGNVVWMREPGRENPGYGYGWWTFPGFYVAGFIGMMQGQNLVVAPDSDMIVVFTTRGGTTVDMFSLFGDRLVGAASAEDPLPANPEALAALEARVAALAAPQPQTVAPLPEKLAQINGVDYALAPPAQMWPVAPALGEYLYGGSMQIEAFMLTFDQPNTATLTLEFSDGDRVDLAVGLDGVSRVTDTRFGPVAMTGTWAATGQGLAMKLEFVGMGEERPMSFGIMGNRAMFICQDPGWSGSTAPPPSMAQPRE